MLHTGGFISMLSECVGKKGEREREEVRQEERREKREDRKYRESENPGKEKEAENDLKCIYFKYTAYHSPPTPSIPSSASQSRFSWFFLLPIAHPGLPCSLLSS